MRFLITLSFFLFINCSFSQDTIRYDIQVFKEGKLVEKNFKTTEHWIKIIYEYDDCGVLTRRWFYDKSGNLIGVIFD